MNTLFHADDLDVKIAYELAGIFSPRRPVSGKRCVEAARLIRERHPSVVALPALVSALKETLRASPMGPHVKIAQAALAAAEGGGEVSSIMYQFAKLRRLHLGSDNKSPAPPWR